MIVDGGLAPAPVRQADWRFLLPSAARRPFRYLVLLGGSSDLADSIVRLNVAQHVSTTLPRDDRADAVVMLAPARESLDVAAHHVAPGGVLYCEIDRRRLGCASLTPRRLAVQLKRRDLHMGAWHWVIPGFPARSTYVPPDNRVLQWYLASLYRSATTGRKVLKAVLRSAASSGWPLRTLVPCYAATAIRGRAPEVPAVVASVCADIGWERQQATWLLLAHGEADANRIALLLFDQQALQPAVVAKFGRCPAFNSLVESEHRRLTEIRPRLDVALRASLPASSLTRCDDLSVGIQTCVAGATLRSRIGAGRPQLVDDVRLVSAWAAGFGLATLMETPPAREWLARHLVNGLFVDYEAQYGLTADERALFGIVAAYVGALRTVPLPIVWQHTDFGPWNIFRSDSRVSVIDWEWARRGPALADLLFFVTHWSAEAARAAWRPGETSHVEALFCRATTADPLGEAITRAIATYMGRLRIPPTLLALLLVYTVVERALLHATRFPVSDGASAQSRAGNRHIAYLAAVARHATRLFSREAARAA